MQKLQEREGVSEIHACATHGVLSDPAIERIAASNLAEVVVTDTIPLLADRRIPRIKVLSVAPLIGEAIKRIHRGESVGALFGAEAAHTQEMLLWEDGLERPDRGDGGEGGGGREGGDGAGSGGSGDDHDVPWSTPASAGT